MATRAAPDWRRLASEALERLAAAGHQPARRQQVVAEDEPGAGPEGAASAGESGWEALLGLVVEWNARMDLTAARSPEELIDLYVADAVVMAAALPAARAWRWVDVGSGGGAPGLPLALLLPEARLTLVEPRAKRVAFLRTALGTLALRRVEVARGRSSELPAGAWDVAVARATLPPELWLVEGARLATRAVWVLLAQGQPPALAGWRIGHDLRYRWPLTGAERRALCYQPEPP